MRRRLFTAPSVLSLALCLATMAMWVRSLQVGDEIFACHTRGVLWQFFSGYGGVSFHRFCGWPDPPSFGYRTTRVVGSDTGVSPIWWPISVRRFNLRMLSIEYGLGRVTIRKGGSLADWGHGPPVGSPVEPWDWSPPANYWRIEIPYWAAVLCVAFLPLWNLLRVRRQAWLMRRGRCVGCGYDLRVTTHRCPECGLPTAASSV